MVFMPGRDVHQMAFYTLAAPSSDGVEALISEGAQDEFIHRKAFFSNMASYNAF